MSYQPKLLDELFTSQQQAAPKTGPLIAEISDENGTDTRPEVEPEDKYTPSSSSASTTSKDEGPSMMELMMQAQQEAQAEKTKAKFEEEKKATKTFAGGFKKGFFYTPLSLAIASLLLQDVCSVWLFFGAVIPPISYLNGRSQFSMGFAIGSIVGVLVFIIPWFSFTLQTDLICYDVVWSGNC